MSDSARPEIVAFRDLELVVRNLADELASFRRRALTAEARLRDLEGRKPDEPGAPALTSRVEELEKENAELNARLVEASGRAQQMLERVRFLRQQSRTAAER